MASKITIGKQRNNQNDRDTKISKTLSWILRHGAISEGLPINSNGFIDLDVVISHKSLRQKHCTFEDIVRVVGNDKKARYTLIKCTSSEKWRIKANQGHSIVEITDLNLRKINDPSEIPCVVHGTYSQNWPAIKRDGLKRMNRNHIHFSISDVILSTSSANKSQAISGFRNNCDILIYIDPVKAISEGIEFFLSENNVILSSGHDGIIAPKYFLKVIDRNTGKLLDF